MNQHEYALLGGINRAQIGRYISIAAALISAILVFVILNLIDIANQFGWDVVLTPSIMSLISAGIVFTVLYKIFDKYAWQWPFISRWLNVPSLHGKWECKGHTLNGDKDIIYHWEGEIIIIQSWDKIRVRLKTSQSNSNSISAALICDEADGYHLLYNYRNDPKIDTAELTAHRGFASLTFAPDLLSAEGEYFNGHGRFTFGTLKLTRA